MSAIPPALTNHQWRFLQRAVHGQYPSEVWLKAHSGAYAKLLEMGLLSDSDGCLGVTAQGIAALHIPGMDDLIESIEGRWVHLVVPPLYFNALLSRPTPKVPKWEAWVIDCDDSGIADTPMEALVKATRNASKALSVIANKMGEHG